MSNRLFLGFAILWICGSTFAQAPSGPDKDKPLPEPERGSFSGQIYKNEFFGLTYEFPQGWSALAVDDLKKVDEENRRQSLDKYGANGQHLVNSGVLIFTGEWTLLRATPSTVESRPGHFTPVILLIAEEGNPFQRGSLSAPGGSNPIDNYFRFSSIADPLQSPDAHMVREPTSVSLGGKDFVRADFRVKRKGGDVWEAWIVTFVKDYFLRLEIGAASQADLDQLAETAKTFSFGSAQK
jgi:hypothetical protein